ncbi:MAG: DUF2267 domain-containing protein [Thermoleophilaceae bacterium]|nr:DUF2267 domain-containing protein [Thermoleophilaceae bacterium]
MPASHVTIIDRSVEKANVWLGDVAEELGTDDRQYAYRVLRATLHALRDRLSVDETAQLAAQLPELIRGFYYADWDPGRRPERGSDARPFLDRVAAEGILHGDTEASFAVGAVMRVLRRHVSEGELADVLAELPAPIRAVLEA